MILSQTAEYALRIMAAISLSRGARPLRASEISDEITCPRHYVSKVLRKLVNAGLLKGTKGHGGGFLLAKSSENILFCDVIDAIEGVAKVKHCIFGWRQCNPEKPCILHNRWSKVSGAFNEWARTTSLADIQDDASRSEWLISLGKVGGIKKVRKNNSSK